ALLVIAADGSAQSTGTPSVLPRPDFHYQGTVGRTYRDSDLGQFPQPVQAPKGAPNVVLILIDDAGFGQFSTFGGGVPSPTMDGLRPKGCASTVSIPPRSAVRRGPRCSPAATITPPRQALFRRRRRVTTATPPSSPAVRARSPRCCTRTGT